MVFYANYLRFFERARTEWLRALGHDQQALREATGGMFVVSEARVRYLRPARLDDVIDVSVRLLASGRTSMAFAQQARRGAQLSDVHGSAKGAPFWLQGRARARPATATTD